MVRTVVFLGLTLAPGVAFAQDVPADVGAAAVDMANGLNETPVATTVRLIVVLTALTFVPAALLVMTPFTRFLITFSLLRQALGLQQTPPNQVLIGLSLFLSALVMQPTLSQVKTEAIDPFLDGQMQVEEAMEVGLVPMRTFMFEHIRRSDLEAVMSLSQIDTVETLDEIPTAAVVSAFVLSELKTAFTIGVKVYIPFLVIDLAVANILLGMGMMVLPPVVISLPFKLLVFVLMDGWNLLIRALAAGFGG